VQLRLIFLMVALLLLSACGDGDDTKDDTNDEPTTDASVAADQSDTADDASSADAAFVKLNLNTASNADFLTIPDMGDRMVREFNEYRPYISIQQFRREIGKYVDEDQVSEYENYVFVPIDYNEADAETLKQIEGIDDGIAATLIDGRPYDSTEAFLAALATHISPEQLALGATYLETQ